MKIILLENIWLVLLVNLLEDGKFLLWLVLYIK